ncbi:hypothetical protein BOTBODRAFT_146028 [Botryobasidium botryosum FD-172 SS1]|uniref:Uncharacterized protein n=1 Tax=Botryobasidium botryosum (strain FD-172 SS1) TaxID=930990 RepID=A0A067MFZ0_BOTB1|nr:hypothetical protein BOTBODRAFT_146028 [Botryobasidium botryosum FD-172 SS1]
MFPARSAVSNANSQLQSPDTPIHRHHFVQSSRVDPFTEGPPTLKTFANDLVATALCRCWHIILFFALWGTCITLICHKVHDVSVQSTLLTVWGTVLGFIISYRTSSSFQRYDEGRKYWSTITYGCRTFVRTVWFHIPDTSATDDMPNTDEGPVDLDEQRARVLIEKKSAVNLVEAFAIAVKHYLRGEEGIYYKDLYHLLKHLPAYALPAGRPSISQTNDNAKPIRGESEDAEFSPSATPPEKAGESELHPEDGHDLPHPVTSPVSNTHINIDAALQDHQKSREPHYETQRQTQSQYNAAPYPEPSLRPSSNPPKSSIFDIFPVSIVAAMLVRRGRHVKGRKAPRMRARRRVVSHNIPLEISLYLSSYIAALQERKAIDVPTTNTLINTLCLLVDSLTGLERILTTPIPFSYSVHLWTVTVIYCLTLPFQIWKTMGWVTIPFTTVTAFIFFGFIVAGEEIENPFGYDKNDLNMDYFTGNIIRQEILAVTAYPIPKVSEWAFSPRNDLFGVGARDHRGQDEGDEGEVEVVPPEEWVKRGTLRMRNVLEAAGSGRTNRTGRTTTTTGANAAKTF